MGGAGFRYTDCLRNDFMCGDSGNFADFRLIAGKNQNAPSIFKGAFDFCKYCLLCTVKCLEAVEKAAEELHGLGGGFAAQAAVACEGLYREKRKRPAGYSGRGAFEIAFGVASHFFNSFQDVFFKNIFRRISGFI